MLGSVLHLSMFCKALVFKWKVKEGVLKKKAKSFFCVFCQKKKNSTFLSKRRTGLTAAVFEEKKHGGEARGFCSSFTLFIFYFWTF